MPEFAPGTVSKILWHFTGGPTWNATTKRQNAARRPASDAYKNLASIIRTRQLRLGSYTETVRVSIPMKAVYRGKRKKKRSLLQPFVAEIESAPVCCLSDIPAAHLGYHAYRYGKFAIGFHRDAAVRHGFNPVFYSLEHTGVVRSIYKGFSQLETLDSDAITQAIEDIRSAANSIQEGYIEDVSYSVTDLESQADWMIEAARSARESLQEFVAFVKTFGINEFATVYCEREWRALRPYSFTWDDVAMIVLPRVVSKRKYLDDFLRRSGKNLKMPRSIPIVPWEDLVEH